MDLDPYFARIGYDGPRTPSLDVLHALHALHPAAIPFEAIDCLLDRGVDLAPEAVDAKLIHGGRGGYCFEHNSLLARVLTTLGFAVQGLAARVRWNMAPDVPAQPRTHMVLRVEIDGESWLADVGFGGCVMPAPIRLLTDHETHTRHDVYRLVPNGGEVRLQVLRDGDFVPVHDLSLVPCVPRDYEMANWFTSTHPTSHFRQNLIAARTTPDARYNLAFNRLTTRPVDGEVTRERLDEAGLERVLKDVFGLPVEPSWRPLFTTAVALGDGV